MTEQKTLVLTGASRGIGHATVKRFSAEGWRVLTCSRQPFDPRCPWPGGEENHIQIDLASPDKTIAALEVIKAKVNGRLDALVNNAGISRVVPHADLQAATPDMWRELHEVNVIAPFRIVAEAEAALRASASADTPSCVINVSSHAGVRPKGASIPYAATKAALNHVTRLLAISLAPDIRVNAIAPGLVDTPMTADWTRAQELWRERSPMRRSASPEDIAQAVSMLIASTYLTGEVLLSDGGLNLT